MCAAAPSIFGGRGAPMRSAGLPGIGSNAKPGGRSDEAPEAGGPGAVNGTRRTGLAQTLRSAQRSRHLVGALCVSPRGLLLSTGPDGCCGRSTRGSRRPLRLCDRNRRTFLLGRFLILGRLGAGRKCPRRGRYAAADQARPARRLSRSLSSTCGERRGPAASGSCERSTPGAWPDALQAPPEPSEMRGSARRRPRPSPAPRARGH
jgi:hypothetical protein